MCMMANQTQADGSLNDKTDEAAKTEGLSRSSERMIAEANWSSCFRLPRGSASRRNVALVDHSGWRKYLRRAMPAAGCRTMAELNQSIAHTDPVRPRARIWPR